MHKYLIFVFILCSCFTPKYYAKYNFFLVDKSNISLVEKGLINADTLYFPRGDFFVGTLNIPSNTYVKTDGWDTKIFQKRKQGRQISPIISVVGSNITIEPITLMGNIDIDKGEWNHAISIIAEKSELNNINLEGLKAFNIRGDGVYIGSRNQNYNVNNVSIKNIVVDNCYRNGISITSGSNIFIDDVDVINTGFLGVDLEMNPNNTLSLSDINITNVNGPSIGIIGLSKNMCQNVTCSNLVLNGDLNGSKPRYTHKNQDGIVIRNSKDIKIENFKVVNQDKYAVKVMQERNDNPSHNLIFSNFYVGNIGEKLKTDLAYFLLGGASSLYVSNFTTDTINDDYFIFMGNPYSKTNLRIDNPNLIYGGRYASYLKVEGINLRHKTSSASSFMVLSKGSKIENSEFQGKKISSFSDDVDMKNTFLRE